LADTAAQTIERLLAVQALDNELASLRREIDELPEKHRLAEINERLETSKAAEAVKESELEEMKGRQLKLDGELDLLSSKIKKEEEKLFSGTVMNPKELSAIQAEILSLRKKRDEMETEDLEEMDSIDTLRHDMVAFGDDKRAAESEERAAKSAYETELAQLRERVAEQEGVRDELKSHLDEETREQYDKLLATKGGVAVVRIEQGRACGGCHVEFSRTLIDRFEHEEGPFTCSYCRRILVK
jgi:predicted  nucleic acid-binding Zn-ribbon protein